MKAFNTSWESSTHPERLYFDPNAMKMLWEPQSVPRSCNIILKSSRTLDDPWERPQELFTRHEHFYVQKPCFAFWEASAPISSLLHIIGASNMFWLRPSTSRWPEISLGSLRHILVHSDILIYLVPLWFTQTHLGSLRHTLVHSDTY